MTSLGENIRFYRKQQNMTLEDLAKVLKVSKQTISRYENGVIPNIPYDKIVDLAAALKVTEGELMGWNIGSKPASSGDHISDKIKEKILEKYSLQGFAEFINLPYRDLVSALDNVRKAPIESLTAIRKGLGVTLDDLLEGNLTKQSNPQSPILLRANNLSPERLALVENLIKEFLKEEEQEDE